MISWRSYTTSKVLPTFVGESGYSCQYSYELTFPRGTPTGTNQKGAAGTESLHAGATINRTLTRHSWQAGETNSFWNATGGLGVSIGNGGLSSERSVTENTTWTRANEYVPDGSGATRQATPSSASSPLETCRQESTKTESYESGYRTTKTISAYEYYDGYAEPLIGYIWTTTVTGNGTDAKTTFEQITAETTQTVEDFKTRQGQRTVVTTTGDVISFKTYTATDGNVEVIAHTIYELNGNTFAATVGTSAEKAITALSFTQGRFTRSYAESMRPITFVVDQDEFTSKTTKTTTVLSNVDTTRVKNTQESWKQWFVDYEYQDACDPVREIYRTTLYSNQYNHFKTEEEATKTNGSQTTFETLLGFDTTTTISKKFNFTGLLRDCTSEIGIGSQKQITRTRTITNTFKTETTTFSISGAVTKTSTADYPGYIGRYDFPWKSYGDGAKRLFSVTNDLPNVISETTITINPETTVNINVDYSKSATYEQGFIDNFADAATAVGSSTENLTVEEIREGEFFIRIVGFSSSRNNATVVRAGQLNIGIANQNLNFTTQNTHENAGIFMTHNAEHTWNSPDFGLISQGVVGAIPLYPTFSGLITEGADGWELCDSSEYTTVNGSRVGQNFSTTIAWQTVEGTSTKNSTSSGSFTLNSASSVPFGVQTVNPSVAGGFVTPNASRTVIVSPGVVLMTTYNASTSGTLSASYSTGTTQTTAPVGPVPVTISSFVPRVEGYGVYTQRLLDNGLP